MERKQEYFEITSPRLNVKELQSILTNCDPEADIVIRVNDTDLRVTKACRTEAVPVLGKGDDWYLGTEITLYTDARVY